MLVREGVVLSLLARKDGEEVRMGRVIVGLLKMGLGI